MSKICYGCGTALQSDDINKVGFIPKEKIESSVYCQRCFRLTHYGEEKKTNIPKTSTSIINSINKDNKFVLFLADFITLNTDIINLFKKIKGKKMLLISKIDAIPKSVKPSLIIDFLKNNYNINDDIRLISSYSNYGINSLLDYLKHNRIYEVYIVGESNSGKSTLINKIIDLTNASVYKITTSNKVNTTLDFIRIKICDELTIIDSPGFVLNETYESLNSFKKAIKPITYQMKDNETLRLNDIFMNFSNSTSITLYMNNIVAKKDFKENEFLYEIKVNDNTDLIIKGYGFINIKSGCIIKFKNINKDKIEVRNSIFK